MEKQVESMEKQVESMEKQVEISCLVLSMEKHGVSTERASNPERVVFLYLNHDSNRTMNPERVK
jgi:hypothetical protein